MDARTSVKSELMAIKQTQAFKKRFDFTRKIIAHQDTAGKEVIPLTNEGPFLCTGYNIKYTKNSTVTRGGVTTNINRVGLRFTAESDNSAQSNDYVPVQLIATPGDVDGVRYGERPWQHLYPEGDALTIEYDNRAPANPAVPGDVYAMANEEIEIVFTGYIFPGQSIK
jgi:hypothetical protein